jgi:hypothetical protein
MTAYGRVSRRRVGHQPCTACGDPGLTKASARLWTPAELAAHLGVDEALLANWRYRRLGPDYIKTGGLVRYEPSAIQRWLVEHTTEYQPGTAREEVAVRDRLSMGRPPRAAV